jgi:hypothetical protein
MASLVLINISSSDIADIREKARFVEEMED